MKTCTKCGQEKPASLEFFYKDDRQESRLRPSCKQCAYNASVALRESRPKPNLRRTFKEKPVELLCKLCNQIKPYDDKHFSKSKKNKFGLETRCKRCQYELWTARYKDNPKRKEYDRNRLKARRTENPDQFRTYQDLRIARKKTNGRAELVDRNVVAERDGWICQLCGVAVDPAITYPSGQSKSLDHIVPLSKGGEHTYENTQLAHLTCNKKKSDKPLTYP